MTNEGVPLPAPDDPAAPKYWMNETGGELVPAIHRYLEARPLTVKDIALICAYFRQWILSTVWDRNPHLTAAGAAALARLRADVFQIRTAADIERWAHRAQEAGADPL